SWCCIHTYCRNCWHVSISYSLLELGSRDLELRCVSMVREVRKITIGRQFKVRIAKDAADDRGIQRHCSSFPRHLVVVVVWPELGQYLFRILKVCPACFALPMVCRYLLQQGGQR